MNIKTFSFFLLRSPAISKSKGCDLSSDFFAQTEDLQYFRKAIEISSPELFKILNTLPLHKKEPLLLKKLLRATRKSTPFGLYSGITFGTFGKQTKVDFEDKKRWIVHYMKSKEQLVPFNKKLGLNPTLWKNKKKFIFQSMSPTLGRYLYKINISKAKIEGLNLEQKIKDFSMQDSKMLKSIQILRPHYTGINHYYSLKFEKSKVNKLDPKLIDYAFNHILEKKAKTCELENNKAVEIGNIAKKMHDIFAPVIWSFQKKNEIGRLSQLLEKKNLHNEVALLAALDPELGILDELDTDYFGSEPLKNNFEALDYYYFSKIYAKNQAIEEWSISEIELNEIEKICHQNHYRKSYLPASFSVIAEPVKENLWLIKHLLGLPGTSLFTRFAHVSSKLEEGLKEIQNWNQKAYSDKILAEIINYPETDIEQRVATRPILTDYVIPLDHPLDLPVQKKIIELNDLKISVCYGKIRLRSVKYNKEVIPFFSSMQNSKISSNPILRILSLVAQQDNFQSVGWVWNGCRTHPYLPRVRFKNYILSLRQWRLSSHEVKIILHSNNPKETIKNLFEQKAIPPQFFFCLTYDRRYFVDISNKILLDFFINKLKNINLNDESFIEEDYSTNHFEFALPFKNTDARTDFPFFSLQSKNSLRIKNLPIGKDCIYFKIYLNHSAFNDFLVQEILPLIDKLKSMNVLKYWFFLRYRDPSPHLRVRIFLKKQEDYQIVLAHISKMEAEARANYHCWKVQLETYAFDIDLEEKDFSYTMKLYQLDSESSLEVLQKPFKTRKDKWLFCLNHIQSLLSHTNHSQHELNGLLKSFSEAYATSGYPAPQEDQEYFGKLYAREREQIEEIIIQSKKTYSISKIMCKRININENIQRIIHLSLNRHLTHISPWEEDLLFLVLFKAHLSLGYRK